MKVAEGTKPNEEMKKDEEKSDAIVEEKVKGKKSKAKKETIAEIGIKEDVESKNEKDNTKETTTIVKKGKVAKGKGEKQEEIKNEHDEEITTEKMVRPSTMETSENVVEDIAEEDNNKEKKSRKKVILISTISVVLFVISMIFSTCFALLNINNNGMISGITIKGIEIQGLNKEESIKRLTEILEQELAKEVEIKIGEFSYSIFPSQIEARYKTEEAVDKAYAMGRGKNIFVNNFKIMKSMLKGEEIEIEFVYNEELLDKLISDIIAKMPDAVIEPSYYREADRLIIVKGQAGNTIDREKAKGIILDKIKNNDSNQIILEPINKKPQKIDIDKIYTEVYTEPLDAYYIEDPFQVFSHVEGVNFDLELARELLKEDKEEYEIPLIITLPEITIDKIGAEAFPNLLARFPTRYDPALRERSENLRLAASKIDGTIVMPGETFSYNKTVGKRSIEEGYREAAGYANGRVVPMLGGGICQISSTLYMAALYADMEIVERSNHMFLTSYLGAGKDATVVWGAIDLKFKNTRQYPIMIKASVQNGIANVDIFGIKEDVEYDIEIVSTILYNISFRTVYETDNSLAQGQERVTQAGMNGCQSVTYRIYKINGVEVSRETLSNDRYDAMNRIVQRGPEGAPTVSNPPVQETPTSTEPPSIPEPQEPPNPPEPPTPDDNSGTGSETSEE